MIERPILIWIADPVMTDAVFMIQTILKAVAGKEGTPEIEECKMNGAIAAFV